MLTIDLGENVALVIGGSRGIGAEISRTLALAGAEVWFTHTGRHPEKAQTLIDAIRASGGTAEARIACAEDPISASRLVEEIAAERGRIDILVTNAGLVVPQPAEDVSDERWTRMLNTNLSSTFYAVRAVLKPMIARHKGKIIMIGSSASYDGGGGAIDYAAAKAGIDGMVLYLNRNYAKMGVVTNSIHPCLIITDLLKSRYGNKGIDTLAHQVPVGRLGLPVDIAAMVAYLASSFGDYICGQSFLVDGGRTLGR